MEYGYVTYQFEVFEGDDFVASGEAPTFDGAMCDAVHYASQCDGVIGMKFYEQREIIVQ